MATKTLSPECKGKHFDLPVSICADAPAVYDPAFMPATQVTCVEGAEVWKTYLPSPHLLHVVTDDERVCVNVEVYRVAKCYANCEFGEYRYCLPQGCPLTYLPAGQYEIVIPRQGVYPVPAGSTLGVDILLEPVGSDFINYFYTVNGVPCNPV